jgi:hypothetical protein
VKFNIDIYKKMSMYSLTQKQRDRITFIAERYHGIERGVVGELEKVYYPNGTVESHSDIPKQGRE